MDLDRWHRITEVFDGALECPSSQRASYLVEACSGDDKVLSEVRRLLDQLERAGDFLERPVATLSQAVCSGDLIAGRYRVETLLGRGGMGEVYCVYDELMDERVALKTLRLDLRDQPQTIRRFQREVRLARKVTHPNVCRVFEAGTHASVRGPLPFFTMQLLEGESLAARLLRVGVFTCDEALPIAVQIAEGLHAIHEAEIIHRDFKSSNIIFSGGKAIITDFGLARAETTLAPSLLGTATTRTQVMGTVAYMSPEQLSGDDITAASDIYSFSVVLFEMITGRPLFEDRHIIQSAIQRAANPGPNIRELAPELDPAWASALTRCLRRDPRERFQSTLDVARALQPGGWRRPALRWTRRAWSQAFGATAAAAGGVALFYAGSRFYLQNAKVPEGAGALLSPIGNLTGDARFNGITELFRSQIAQSVHLNLIEDSVLGQTLTRMGKAADTAELKDIREAAWRLNAAISIFGTVSRLGPDFVINLELETRGSTPNHPGTKVVKSLSASDPAALMRSVRDASVWVRETAGESATKISAFDQLPQDVTTPSWEALTFYARGQRFYMAQDYESALLELESALRIDPKFTLAALRRADLLVSRARQSEGFRQWKEAIAMLGARPITRAEELNARAMFAFDSGDIDGNDRFCRTWSLEYPADWKPAYYRIIGLILNGHAEQALELLARLLVLQPNFGDLYAQAIAAHLVLGHTEQARSLVGSLARLNSPERSTLREGFVRFREGNCIGFLEILRSLESSKNRRAAADAMLHEAMLLIDTNLPALAAQRVQQFLSAGSWTDSVPEQAQLKIVQAWAEMLSGDRANSVRRAREAIQAETGPMVVALAGTVFARAQERKLQAAAQDICAGLMDLNLYRIAHLRIAGEAAMADGDRPGAVRQFRSAAQMEPKIAHRQYLIEALSPSDPEAVALCENVVRIPWQALRPPPLHSLGSLRAAIPIMTASGTAEPFVQRFSDSAREFVRAVKPN